MGDASPRSDDVMAREQRSALKRRSGPKENSIAVSSRQRCTHSPLQIPSPSISFYIPLANPFAR
jgi:hypothetical protein